MSKCAREIAAAGKGMYVRADNTNSAFESFTERNDKMKKQSLTAKFIQNMTNSFSLWHG